MLCHYIISRVNHSAKCKVWRASRDAEVKNHDLGGMIARSYKGREIASAICIHKTRHTEIQGCEVKVRQFRVRSEVQTVKHSEPRAAWILKVTQGL